MNPFAGLALALVAAALGIWFAVSFADWNKQQACVTTGGKRCGGAPVTWER